MRRRSFLADRADGHVGLRQEERERAACAQRAGQPDLTAKQTRNFAADRQTKAGTTVLSAGAAIRLEKGFKDYLLFVRGNTDARIGDGECDDRARAIEHFVFRIPAFRDWSNPEDNAS